MILLLVFIVSFFLWYRNKRTLSILFLYILVSNGLDIKYLSDEIIPIHNYIFLFTNLILIQDWCKGRLKQDINNDSLLRIIVYGYLFFIIHCLVTVILGQDNIRYAFSVLRVSQWSLLLYLIVRKLQIYELEKGLKYIAWIIIIHCFLYLCQYGGINVFKEEYSGEGVLRNGTPASLPLYLLLSLFVFRIKRVFILYLLPLIFGGARGVLVSLIVAICFFFRKKLYKLQYLIVAIIASVIIYWGYNNYVANNVQRYDISMMEEIAKGFDWKTITDFTSYDSGGSHFTFKDNGTFAFRISMVLERFIYIISNPFYLPFGVGAIAEVSPYNHFNFYIGTEQEDLKYGIAQIDSVDIVWSSVILRYGLFGIIFWCLFIKECYRLFKQNTKSPYFIVGGIYLWFFIFNSFGSAWVIHGSWLLPFFILIVYCSKTLYNRQTDNGCICNNSNV